MWAPARRLTAARIGLARSGASTRHHAAARFPPGPRPRARRGAHRIGHRSAPHSTCKTSVRPHPSTSPKAPRPTARHTCSAPISAANSNPAPRCPRIPAISPSSWPTGCRPRPRNPTHPPVLAALLPALHQWRIAPIVIARHGRVALGDAIARQRAATSVLILLGERPGLSAPDSLGAYITWNSNRFHHHADRNCISNIRPEVLPPAEAARRIWLLLERMRERGFSGVALKDESAGAAASAAALPTADHQSD